MEKAELFPRVKLARERASGLGLGKKTDAAPARVSSDDLAPDTLRTYRRIFNKHMEDGQGLDGVKRASWTVHKCALLHGYRETIKGLMRAQSEAQKQWNWALAGAMITEALEMMDGMEAIQAATKPTLKARKQSKRSVSLPKGWQARTLDAAKSDDEKAILAVLWSTGCRPLELERGVRVTRKDGALIVQIDGAKTSEHTKAGQGIRTLTLDPHSEAGRALDEWMDVQPQAHIHMDRRPLEKLLERIGRNAGLKPRLSAYNYKHAVTSSLKTKNDPDLTARALGHVSGLSQKPYGTAGQAHGGGAIVDAQGTKPVRKVRSPDSRGPQARQDQPSPG